MKKLILATVIMSISTCALAKEPFRYGIGMCEYAYSGRSDSIMYSVKGAHRMPELVYEQQDKYCGSEENIAKAEEQLKKWKALPESATFTLPCMQAGSVFQPQRRKSLSASAT